MKSKTTTKKEATHIMAKAMVQGIADKATRVMFDGGMRISKGDVLLVTRLILDQMNGKKFPKELLEQAIKHASLLHDEYLGNEPF